MSGRKSNSPSAASPPAPAAPDGVLYLVATPIGNLEDITLRALRVLGEVRWIACEDTRRTAKLLERHAITAPLVSYHEHNERQRTPELLAALSRGESVALVTDAGTPLISDPGFRLVTAAIARGYRIVPLPGPSAVIAALAGSGLPCGEFLFAGFLPARSAERRRALERLRAEPRTIVLFEAPHRLAASLADAAEILGPRPAVLARELTKLYEEFRRGTLAELAASVRGAQTRGEITLVIGPPPPGASAPEAASQGCTEIPLSVRVAQLIAAEGSSRNAALKQAARERGITRREAYRRLLEKR